MTLTRDAAMANPVLREAILAQERKDRPGGSGAPDPVKPTPNEGLSHRAYPRTWSRAVPTTAHGIRFPSKMEARVYGTLKASLKVGERLYRQVRFPLLSIAPTETGVPLAFTVDFVIVGEGGWRVVDAKGSRKSREWERGKRAFEACYGLTVEEVSR